MCSLTTTQTNLCTSGIGKVTDPILLLQLLAQLNADLLAVSSPGTSTLVADILSRACTSGIGKVTDEIMLLQIIAQNGCELVT
jgi:hypothetical protein